MKEKCTHEKQEGKNPLTLNPLVRLIGCTALKRRVVTHSFACTILSDNQGQWLEKFNNLFVSIFMTKTTNSLNAQFIKDGHFCSLQDFSGMQ